MTTIAVALPAAPKPQSVAYTLRRAQSSVMNPFTLREEIHDWGGERWEADVRYPPMTRDQMQQWRVWIGKGRGRRGEFLLDAVAQIREGAGHGLVEFVTPNAIERGDREIEIQTNGDGPDDAIPNFLRAGDFISVAQYLHIVEDDVDLPAGGAGVRSTTGTFTISPGARRDFPQINHAIVQIARPRGLFRLAEGSVRWEVGPTGLWSLAFRAVESI